MKLTQTLLMLLMLDGCGMFSPAPEVSYTVVRGDTLTVIAKAHGVSVAELQAWNELKGDRIEVGQVLVIKTGEPVAKQDKVVRSRGPTTRSSTKPKTRRLPKAKTCLKGPSLDDLDDDEADIQSSAGLSMEQVRGPMRSFLPGLAVCFDEGWPEAVVDLELTVGCNGRVANVRVLDGDGLGEAVLGCMKNELQYVGFPAHDMADGMSFRYPITLAR